MSNRINQFLDMMKTFEAIDLTHTMEEKMPTFPGHTKFFLNEWVSPGDPAYLSVISMGDHSGTHYDAPAHFVRDPADPNYIFCEQVPLMSLTGHALKLTFGPFGPDNSTISAADIQAWERENVAIAEDDIVIFDYQWAGDKWCPVDERNAFLENWPGLDESAVHYLLEKKIRVAGTDCASIDAADGAGFVFPGHFQLLCNNVLLLENLMNLDKVPNEFIFMALPLKLKGAGASPIRAVALVPR